MHEIAIAIVSDDEAMSAAYGIRREVFCREQGVSEADEMDGLDGVCRHYLVREQGAPIGTARTRGLSDGSIKVERVAVLRDQRGTGVGRALMERIIADIVDDGAVKIVLNSQTHVADFYARLGFVAEGEVFDEAGIPHIRMVMVAKPSVRPRPFRP